MGFLNVEGVVPEMSFDTEEACLRSKVSIRDVSHLCDEVEREVLAEALKQKICEALACPLRTVWATNLLQCITELMPCLPPATLVRHQAFDLSMSQDGSRLVQSALQEGNLATQSQIATELHGHACEMMGSPHANHVLQRLIELLPPSQASFVLTELSMKWNADYLAKHKFGCRILERVIEHFSASSSTKWILDEFLDVLLQHNAVQHMFHSFATFILQHILEHGSLEHKRVIVAALRSDLERAAKDTHASGVLDKALSFMPHEDQAALAGHVLSFDGLLVDLTLADKPAAAQLIRVVRGPLLAEAERQLSAACNIDDSSRTKICRMLGGNKVKIGAAVEVKTLMVPKSQNMMPSLGVDMSVNGSPSPTLLGLDELIAYPVSWSMEVPQQQMMAMSMSAPTMYESFTDPVQSWWGAVWPIEEQAAWYMPVEGQS